MKKKIIICIDIDNTICSTKGKIYSKSTPYKKKIRYINSLYDSGYYIKIFTSRYMGRNKENIKKVYNQGFKKTEKQLLGWKLKFHELIMGKPSFDILIDDKSIFFEKNWIKNVNLKLKKKKSKIELNI